MLKRRIVAWSGVLVAASLVLSACGSGTQTGSGSEGGGGSEQAVAAKIGILLPQSGDLADLGQPMIQAAQLAIADINAAGGIWNGTQIQGIVRDDGTAEDKGRDGADQLVNVEKVSAIVGAAGSGVSQAGLSVAGPAGVPMCSPSSTSPTFTTSDQYGMFVRTAPSDALQGRAIAKLAIDNGWKTAAVLGLNNPYGQGVADVFAKAFPEMGGTMALDPVLYDPKATDFTSEVQKVADAKPQVVVLVAYPDTGTTVLKEAAQIGLVPAAHFILTDGMKDAKLPSEVGQGPDGKLVTAGMLGTSPAATGPGFDAFISEFKAKYGDQMAASPYLGNTYDCMVLEALALQKVGPDKAHDGKAIVDAMIQIAGPANGRPVDTDLKQALADVAAGKDIHYNGASSTFDMDQVGDVITDYEIYQYDDQGNLSTIKTVAASDIQ